MSSPLTFSSLIASGDLLDQNAAKTTPQYLVVTGPLVADIATIPNGGYTFANNSEIIFTDADGGITVGIGSQLNLKGTYVHGCDALWNRIQANAASVLNISDNSILENAAYAVFLNPGSTFNCANTTFNGNYISIYAGASNPSGPANLLGFNVSGCTFDGSAALLNAYTPSVYNPYGGVFSIPNIAILLHNVSSVKVGNEAGGTSAQNTFRNYTQTIYPPMGLKVIHPGRGVYAVNSNPTVVNSRFVNIGAADNTNVGYGVSALSNTKSHTINVFGLGSGETATPTFENVHRAASIVNANLSFKDARVKNCHEGVLVTIDEGVALVFQPGIPFIDIANNRIEEICSNAIRLYKSAPSGSAKIDNNKIDFNSTNSNCGVINRGIWIENDDATPLNGQGYVLSDNIITHISSPAPTRLQAIETNGVTHIRHVDNTVTDEDASNGLFSFTGIQLGLGSRARLEDNTVTGVKTNYFVGTSSGINNIASGNVLMLCNTTDAVNRGINFNGFECDAADFKVNTMNTHAYGLYLQEGTRMGDQFEKQNYWEGSSGQVEGKFEFSGYDPGNSMDVAFVQHSRFIIDILDETDERWANPREVDTDDDSGNVWFTGSRNNYLGQACAETIPGPTKSDNLVFNDSFPAYRGLESSIWEARFHTFGRLYEDTTLRSSATAILSWYNNHYDSTYAALYRIYADMNALGKPKTTLLALRTSIDSLILERDTLEATWYAATVDSVKAVLFTQLETFSEDVAEAQADLDSLMTLETTAFSSAVDDLRDRLDSLSLADTWETNLAAVLDIVLDTELGTDTLTGAQEADLDSIAQQCRMAGGFGVRLARHVLGYDPTTQFAIDTSCVAEERAAGNSPNTAAGNTCLFPNPAGNTFYLAFEQPALNREVRVFDPLGRMVAHTNNANGVQQRISLDRTAAGLYVVHVMHDGGSLEVLKVYINSK